MRGKRFSIWRRSDNGRWMQYDVEVKGIDPAWEMTPTLARIAARQASHESDLPLETDVIVEVIGGDEDYMYHLHPSSETKLAKDYFISLEERSKL